MGRFGHQRHNAGQSRVRFTPERGHRPLNMSGLRQMQTGYPYYQKSPPDLHVESTRRYSIPYQLAEFGLSDISPP
jgi:hypothetical protein